MEVARSRLWVLATYIETLANRQTYATEFCLTRQPIVISTWRYKRGNGQHFIDRKILFHITFCAQQPCRNGRKGCSRVHCLTNCNRYFAYESQKACFPDCRKLYTTPPHPIPPATHR